MLTSVLFQAYIFSHATLAINVTELEQNPGASKGYEHLADRTEGWVYSNKYLGYSLFEQSYCCKAATE